MYYIVAIFLVTAMLLSGCGTKEKIKIDDDKIVASVGDIEMDYAAASTYKRIMQAETYSYLQQYASTTDIWTEELIDGDGTYGEQLDAGVIDAVEEMLLAQLHSQEYDVEFTDDDEAACEEVIKTFLFNTSDEGLEAMHADEESVMEVLELITVNAKVKSKIIASATPEVTDDEVRQAAFECVSISVEDNDDPEAAADEILEKTDEESLEDVAGDFPYTTGNYTVQDPEYDDFVDGLIEHLEGMSVGEYSVFIDEDGNAYILCLTTDDDEEATESKRQSVLSDKMDAAYDDILAQWKEEDEVTIDEEAWATLEADANAVYQAIEVSDSDA